MANGNSYTLIQTKLHIPHVSSELVPRPRLFERLNEGLETNGSTDEFQPFKRKLTLVTAPAGWISLDENDNNLEVLIRYVIAAIRT